MDTEAATEAGNTHRWNLHTDLWAQEGLGAKAPPGEATESGSGPRPPNPGRGYNAGPGEQGLSQGTSCKLHWPHPGHNPQPDLRPHLLFQPFQTLLVFADLPQLLQRRVHPRQPGLQARDSSLPAPPTSGRPPLELRLPPRCLGPAPSGSASSLVLRKPNLRRRVRP